MTQLQSSTTPLQEQCRPRIGCWKDLAHSLPKTWRSLLETPVQGGGILRHLYGKLRYIHPAPRIRTSRSQSGEQTKAKAARQKLCIQTYA